MNLFEFEHRRGFPYLTGLYGLESYAVAYWRSAKTMIDHKLFDGQGRPDFSTFPIAFLYRHALELMLKAILIEHHATFSMSPELLLEKRGHKLINEYLADLRTVVESAGILENGEFVVNLTNEQWSYIENVLKDWQKQDPDGMAFRYSIDRKAKTVTLDHTFTFDPGHFSRGMEGALEILAELKADLDHLRYQDILQAEGL